MESYAYERLTPLFPSQERNDWKKFKKRIAVAIILFIVLFLIIWWTYTYTSKVSMPNVNYFTLPCLLLGTSILRSVNMQELYPCDSKVYCQGPLLHAAQFAYIYNDSKSFVDMQMAYDEEKVLADFDKLLNATGNSPSSVQVQNFVHEHFLKPGSEFESWTPSDWTKTPSFLNGIKDPKLKAWAEDLNLRWKDLGRKIKDEVRDHPSRNSMIYSSNPVVVPGGRFREFYYWDNYWIIRGLLLSEMYETVKGTITNFLELVEKFGFVPNGGRLYYTRRSQPPFLTIMVRDYVRKTGDYDFMEKALPTLQKEYSFWELNRTVVVKDTSGKSHSLTRYGSDVNKPRAESYREDYDLVNEHELSEDAKMELMTHVTSACESGWDFSSRWTGACREEESALLLSLRTRDVIPVDLNSILCDVEEVLAEFNSHLGRQEVAENYLEKYRNRVEAIEKILWNENDGTYYDFVISQASHNRNFFLSNVNLLWTKAYPAYVDVEERETRILNYLNEQTYNGVSVLDFPGGLPTSLNYSGEQWDFPNAWPPIAHMTIEGMRLSNVTELQQEAFRQAQKLITIGWRGFTNPEFESAMFEKYNVLRDDGVPGHGGEYEVQEGFGWTNGVALIFLDAYGQSLTAEGVPATEEPLTTTSDGRTANFNGLMFSICAAISWVLSSAAYSC